METGKRQNILLCVLAAAAGLALLLCGFLCGRFCGANNENLKSPAAGIALCILLAAAGLALLIWLVFNFCRRNEQAEQKLAELQEQNAVMKLTVGKTVDMAHLQRLETIGTMTAGIAHEFNNLLTPIMGYSLLTLEKLPDDSGELYDNILAIYNASQSAKELVARITAISRKDDGRTFLPLSPDTLLKRALQTAEPYRPEQVTVRTNYGGRGYVVMGSETRLVQMLLNLIINACYAMPDGGTLAASVAISGEKAVFTVADTGTGIAPEVLPHIFDPFFTTKGPAEGTGLGLPIAAQTAEDHGGKITVRTEPGKGSTFFVFLPARLQEIQGGDEIAGLPDN